MLRSFDFSQSNWKEDDFLYAASVRVPYRLTFEQAASCIHKEHAEERGDEYAYVSMVLREKVHAPATLKRNARSHPMARRCSSSWTT